jgi:hypothetical protein
VYDVHAQPLAGRCNKIVQEKSLVLVCIVGFVIYTNFLGHSAEKPKDPMLHAQALDISGFGCIRTFQTVLAKACFCILVF